MVVLVRRQLNEQYFSQAWGFMDFPVSFFIPWALLLPKPKIWANRSHKKICQCLRSHHRAISALPGTSQETTELPLYTVKYYWCKNSQIQISVSEYFMIQMQRMKIVCIGKLSVLVGRCGLCALESQRQGRGLCACQSLQRMDGLLLRSAQFSN